MLKIFLSGMFMAFAVVASSQSVGIGTATPTEKLDVTGNVKADTLKSNSLKIAANAGIGKVLTSDVNGAASWQTSAATTKAINGLTKSNDTVRLGGVLQQNTTLHLDAKAFSVTDTAVGAVVTIEQTIVSGSVSLSSTAVMQTFLVNSNGSLESIKIFISALAGSTITAVLKDAGNNILGTSAISYPVDFDPGGFDSYLFPNPRLSAGQEYSISLTATGTAQVFYDNANPYADGVSSIGANADIGFRVFTANDKNLLYFKSNRLGINTNSPVATLDINGSLKVTDGSQGTGKLLVGDASGKASWQIINAANYGGWGTTGNAGTTTAHFIGTTDDRPLLVKTNNIRSGLVDHANRNYFIGQNAGLAVSTGTDLVAIGQEAMFKNTTGFQNTSFGSLSLYENINGAGNTAGGYSAIRSNITGNINTAYGSLSLYANQSGNNNVAIGGSALISSTTGSGNTGIGKSAGETNITGSNNTFLGFNANVPVGSTSLTNATAIGANAIVGSSNSLVLGNNVNVGIGVSAPGAGLHIKRLGITNPVVKIEGTQYNTEFFTEPITENILLQAGKAGSSIVINPIPLGQIWMGGLGQNNTIEVAGKMFANELGGSTNHSINLVPLGVIRFSANEDDDYAISSAYGSYSNLVGNLVQSAIYYGGSNLVEPDNLACYLIFDPAVVSQYLNIVVTGSFNFYATNTAGSNAYLTAQYLEYKPVFGIYGPGVKAEIKVDDFPNFGTCGISGDIVVYGIR